MKFLPLSLRFLFGVLALSISQNIAANDANQIPGVELRELEQVTPDLYRAPKPIEFVVPEIPPMKAVADEELTVSEYVINGNVNVSDADILTLLDQHKGTITFQELFNAVTKITLLYRGNGFLVARAYVPEQEVTDGIVEVVVLEGVLGDVHVKGDKHIKSGRIAKHLLRQVRSGVINQKDMEYGALLLNDLPGSSTSVNLEPGSETGLSDVRLDMKDDGQFDFSLDYNNFGTPVTGEHRFGAQIGLNNLFKSGDRFSLRPIISDTGDTIYGSLGFSMPVFTPATKLGLSFSHLDSELGEGFEDLGIENTASIISLNASHAFIRSRSNNVYATFNYDIRSFERVCTFCQDLGIPDLEDTEYDLDVVQLGTNGDFRDSVWGGGANTWYASLRLGTTDLGEDAGLIIPGTERVEGKFTTFRLGGHRVQKLKDRLSLSLKLDTQFSSDDLDPAERFSLGGSNGVRAYRPSEALADNGALLQTELRYQVERLTNRYKWLTSFEPYLFVDGGTSELNDNGNNISRDLTQQRTGWGLGLRLKGSDNFHADLAVATRLTDRESLVDQPDDDETNFWIQLIYWH